MAEVILQIPQKIYFGSDMLNLIGSICSEFGSRALLLADYNLHEGRYIERVIDSLQSKGSQCILIDDMGSCNSYRTITETVEVAKSSRAELILAMGGSCTLINGRTIVSRYRSTTNTAEAQRVAYIEILTVFRFPLLLRTEYFETNLQTMSLKLSPIPPGVYKAAVIDPGVMAGISSKYAGTLLLDSLLHALEGYSSPEGNFISEPLFRGSLVYIGEALKEILRGEKSLRYRVRVTQAGVLSALGYTGVRMGPTIALCYTLHQRFNIPKSWIGTVLLPHLADTYEQMHPEKLAEAAALLGENTFGMNTEEAAASFCSHIRRALAILGLPTRLRDFDLKLPKLVEAAEDALALDTTNAFTIPLSVDSIYDFLKRAY